MNAKRFLFFLCFLLTFGPMISVPSDETPVGKIHIVVQDPLLATKGPAEVLDVRGDFALIRPLPYFLQLHHQPGLSDAEPQAEETRNPFQEFRDPRGLPEAAPQAVEIQARPRLIRLLEFEDQVTHAALGPDALWCVVALKSGIFRIDLLTGKREKIMQGYKVLNFSVDETGTRIGFFGHETDSQDPEPEYARGQPSTLGVWDLRQAKWRTRHPTPFSIEPFAISHSHLVWSEGDVWVEAANHSFSNGGRSGHLWQFRLRGEEDRLEISQRKENRGEEVDSREFSVISSDWTRRNRVSKVLMNAWARVSDRGFRHDWVSMVQSGEEEVQFVWRRAKRAVSLSMNRKGTWIPSTPPPSHNGRPRAVGGRLIASRKTTRQRAMFCVSSGKTLASIPIGPDEREALHYLPSGWISQLGGQLHYFEPDHTEPKWSIQTPEPASFSMPDYLLRAPVSSPDGSMVALAGTAAGADLLRIHKTADGSPVLRLSGPSSHRPLRADAAFVSPDRIAYLTDKELVLHEVPSGRLLSKVDLAQADAVLHAPGRGWLLAQAITYRREGNVLRLLKQTVIFNEHLEEQARITDSEVSHAHWLETAESPKLLIAGAKGDLHLYDPAGKGVENIRPASWHLLNQWRSISPRTTLLVWDRLLIREFGIRGIVEMIDIRNFETLLYLQAVTLGPDRWGWIAWTPDGFFDASPGAEEMVEVFVGLTPASADFKDRRRNPSRIQARIMEAAGAPKNQ